MNLLRKTLSKRSVLFFFATILFVGTVHAVYLSFLFVLLKEIKCPNFVMGLCMAVAAFSSMFGIKSSGTMIHLLGGTFPVLCLGTFTWCVRFLAYYFMIEPYIVLPVHLLHFFCFGMFVATSAIHIRKTCAPDIYSSMFGIFNGLFFGAGFVLGNVIGGNMVMEFGVRMLFLVFSVASALWTAIMLLYIFRRKCSGRHY